MVSFRDVPWILLIWLSQRGEIDGLEVRVSASPVEAREVFAGIAAACKLIARYDARLYGRMRRSVRRILVTEASGGHYLPRLETCRIGLGATRRSSAIELAMLLVHEATHARLWKAGCRYAEKDRARIERMCVDAEVAFAQRVPGSEAAVATARALLDTAWWRAEATSRRSIEELRRLGCPEWVLRRLS